VAEQQGPTLESVSRVAGVSRQTVSNVLNAPERVRPETRERVLAAIRAVGYQPNRNARSLRTRASRLLGYCVTPGPADRFNPVLDRFLHAVTDAAEARGYHVLLFTAPESTKGDMSAYEALLAQQSVDGFILSDTVVGDPRQRWLESRGVPFVAFGRSWTTPEIGSWVDVDGAAGMSDVVDHLYERGHRRIAFIGWPSGSGVGDDRRRGWTEACQRHGLSVSLQAEGEQSVDTGRRLATSLLDLAEPPTALVCVSDLMAVGALQAVRDRCLRPGHDVAVTGFDDSPLAALPGIDLTSVRQPLEQIGQDVVRLLLDRLASSSPSPSSASTAASSPSASTSNSTTTSTSALRPASTAATAATATVTSASPRHVLLRPSLIPRSSTVPTLEVPQ